MKTYTMLALGLLVLAGLNSIYPSDASAASVPDEETVHDTAVPGCPEENRVLATHYGVGAGVTQAYTEPTAIIADTITIAGTLTTQREDGDPDAPSLCLEANMVVVESTGTLCTGAGAPGTDQFFGVSGPAIGTHGGSGGNLSLRTAGTSLTPLVVKPGGHVCTGDGGEGGSALMATGTCLNNPAGVTSCLRALSCGDPHAQNSLTCLRQALSSEACAFLESVTIASLEIECSADGSSVQDLELCTGDLEDCLLETAALCTVLGGGNQSCWHDETVCDGRWAGAAGGNGGSAGAMSLYLPSLVLIDSVDGAFAVGNGGDGGDAVAYSRVNGDTIAFGGEGGSSQFLFNGQNLVDLVLSGDPVATAFAYANLESGDGGDGGDALATVEHDCTEALLPTPSTQSSASGICELWPDNLPFPCMVENPCDDGTIGLPPGAPDPCGPTPEIDPCGDGTIGLPPWAPDPCGPTPEIDPCGDGTIGLPPGAPDPCGDPLPPTDPCVFVPSTPGLCEDPSEICPEGVDRAQACGQPLPSTEPCDYVTTVPGTCGNPVPVASECVDSGSKSTTEYVVDCFANQVLLLCQTYTPSRCEGGPLDGDDGADDTEAGSPAPTGLDGYDGDPASAPEPDVDYEVDCGFGLTFGLTGPTGGFGCTAYATCDSSTGYAATNGDHAYWNGAEGGDAIAQGGHGTQGIRYGGSGGSAWASAADGADGANGGSGGAGDSVPVIAKVENYVCSSEEQFTGANGGYGANAGKGGLGISTGGDGAFGIVGGNGGNAYTRNGAPGEPGNGGDAGPGAVYEYCDKSYIGDDLCDDRICVESWSCQDQGTETRWTQPGQPGCGGRGNNAGGFSVQPGAAGFGIIPGMLGLPSWERNVDNTEQRGRSGALNANGSHIGGNPNPECPYSGPHPGDP